MKITSLTLLFLLFVMPFKVFADEEENVRDLPTRERILVGGNIGLQIGNINTSIVISPNIGYRLTNRLTSGLGLTYQYYRSRGLGIYSGVTSSMHIYGGSVFTSYRFTRAFFAHTEFELLNLDSRVGVLTHDNTGNRIWEQNYFIGGGYRAPLGERASLNLMLLYNLNQNSRVYFQNPIFRFGIDVRL
jgi:hypothetical protein